MSVNTDDWNTPTEFSHTKWPWRGPTFNVWHRDVAAFAKAVQDSPDLWLRDSALKYLEIRIDTRTGDFIVKDRDGNRVSPDRVIAAAQSSNGSEG